MKEHQKILKIVSHLLQYPDSTWRNGLPEWRNLLSDLQSGQIKTLLSDFFTYAENFNSKEFEDQYVRCFDFSQNTNLYLTSYGCAQSAQQRSELLAFKAFYNKNNFALNHELPDYLPAILELCAAINESAASEILLFIQKKLELLRQQFIESKLAYVFLIDVILTIATGLEGTR